MAATYRSSSSANTGATTSTTLAIPVPSGVQVNDYLLASIAVDGGTASTSTPPSGWTLIISITDTTNTRLSVYGRIVTGYEPATPTWTFDTTRAASGNMVAYSGAHSVVSLNNTSTTTASASTSVGGSSGIGTYSGMLLKFIATRNTTAVSTITTPATSYTKIEDTCTTASPYIGASAQHAARTMPLSTLNGTTTTVSTAATAAEINLMVEDARPAFNILADDTFRVSSFTTARVTNGVGTQVGYPNTLLLAFVSIPKDNQTVSSIVTTGLTWELVARANAVTGSCEVWRTMSSVAFTQKTVTVNYSASVLSGNIMVASIVGADMTGVNGSGAIGAVNTGSSASTPPSISLTTTRDNSWVWAMAGEATATIGTINPGTNQTILRTNSDTTNTAGSWMWRQIALTGTSGTNVTMNTTNPASTSCNIVTVEILPAIRKNLGIAGVG